MTEYICISVASGSYQLSFLPALLHGLINKILTISTSSVKLIVEERVREYHQKGTRRVEVLYM